ncbi:MAG: hypothetical protein KGH95_00010 [Thaumarchaeota archaeon]|nr:hypothetical protein [Nitrososphaerota archaeon]
MSTTKFFFILLLLPISLAFAEPAVPGTVLTFYINDINLSTDHRAVMTIPTSGLVDFTINGVPIDGPGAMVETGIDTGTFQLQLTLPGSVNGKSLKDGDVVVMTYHQKADYSGNPTDVTQSKVLASIQSSPVASSSSNVRIGQYFKLQLYAPNYNLDSFTPDDIPLDMIEVHMGGVQTTLADSSFQVNPYTMRETGPNTDNFEVNVKIPKSIDGFPVEMGSTIEFRFKDPSMPSSVFVTVGGTFSSSNSNYGSRYGGTTPPPVLPSMTFYSANSVGAKVNYTNSALLSGLQSPVCSPLSGSFFMTGSTTVTCAARDANGNSVIKTFTIHVTPSQNKIPSWIKKIVESWCTGDTADNQLSSSLQYLVMRGIMSVQGDSNLGSSPDKTTLCLWSDSKVSDSDVANSLYLLSK